MEHGGAASSRVPRLAVRADGSPVPRRSPAGAPPPTVRVAARRELHATGRLHERWLPSGFFARLGRRFLRTYHATFRSSPAGIALVADGGTQPVGFLVGTLDNEQHYHWVARHRAVPLAVVGVRSLLADRELLLQFLRTRLGRYSRSIRRRIRRRPVTAAAHFVPATGSLQDESSGPVAVLTHVAVAPAARGTGTGRRLVETFVDHARAAGAREVRLVTPVATDAPSFYRRLGWHTAGRRLASDGTLVEEFRLPLQGT